MSFSFLAVLYVGTFLLLTGQIGIFGLCSFSCAFNVDGVGFFLSRYLTCLLLKMRLFCCSIS